MSEDNTRSVVEALLFMSERPILGEQIKKVVPHLSLEQVKSLILELQSEYESSKRGIRVYEVAGGYQMIAAPEFITFLKKLHKGGEGDKLSKPALETLAIIAYKQPITKMEIETLRNVNIDGVVKSISDRNLIRVVGRKKAPGRPKVYGTTRTFLEYFGLNSLEDLPKIEQKDFKEAVAKNEASEMLPKGEHGENAQEVTNAH
jgi:segregation and condensation protein B